MFEVEERKMMQWHMTLRYALSEDRGRFSGYVYNIHPHTACVLFMCVGMQAAALDDPTT